MRKVHRRNVLVAVALVAALGFGVRSAGADPPAFENVPGDQTVEATGPGGASASWGGPDATDGSPVNCSPSSGSTFDFGQTTVTCSASNVDGESSVSFTITVHDTTEPSVSVPDSVSAAATGPGGATVTFSASASDSVSGSLTPDCSPSSGSTFGLGTTTVTCTATDGHGNTGSASFGVTVSDTGAPSITVPGDISTPATGLGGAAVSFSVSASDAIDPSPGVSCDHASGSTFGVGQTTVTCTATDASGNSASGSFKVTVTDTTPPTVTVPSDMTAEATGAGGAAVGFSASGNDAVWGSLSASCSPGSGSTFPLGTTTVSCSATDGSGNTGSASFSVTVRDTTPPVISVPGGFTREATEASGAVVTYSVSANDAVDGGVAPTCSQPSGSLFGRGVTTVTCTATDGHSNSASASFKVNVTDGTPPSVPPVGTITVEADSTAGATVTYQRPTATDLGEPITTSCTPEPGSVFPLGATKVVCSARDGAGNTGTGTFTVIVVDTTKPTLNVPKAITVSSNGAASLARTDATVAAFLQAAQATDIVDGIVPVTNDVPASLPVGTATITFTATDKAGNRTTAQSKITVVTGATAPVTIDATPPGDVGGLKAKPGDRSVLLTWTPPRDADFDHVTIARSAGSGTGTVVYQGAKKSFKNTGLTNGTEYRYVVVAHDEAGNASRGLVIRATPKEELLTAPAEGVIVTQPPVLRWKAASGATYYNVQLYRVSAIGKAAALATKILSVWPVVPQFALPRTWNYSGKKQLLAPGRYAWYVWPGIGAKTANKYGPLLGQRTFTFKNPAKPKAKPKPKPKPKKKPAKKKS